jgi:hypothetical protein
MFYASSVLLLVFAVIACPSAAQSVPKGELAAPLPTRPPVAGAPAGTTAFVDVSVIPMDTERILTGRTVLVKDGRITTVLTPEQRTVFDANARDWTMQYEKQGYDVRVPGVIVE